MARKLIAVVSDIHAGSTVAICPPRITLDDGGAYEASAAQRWLWGLWTDFWAWVDTERRGDELFIAFNGDMVDGDHHGTAQILSRNPTAQAEVLEQCLAVPLALNPDALFCVRGTESHVGKSASAEERTAKRWRDGGLPVHGDPDTGTASWWHLRMEVEGLLIDFAHHGRTGYRPWTRPNASNLLAMQIFTEHALAGERAPDLAVRSHFHRYMESARAGCPTRVVQTAAWQLATGYVHKVAPESLADIGGLLIEIEDGQYTIRPRIHAPSRGAIWTAA